MEKTKLKKEFKSHMKKTSIMNKSSKRGIFLAVIVLFSISLILIPSNVYAEKISAKSVGVDKTSIITFTNDGKNEIKIFRIWLSQDANFQSFKTEKGWSGEKSQQGVIVFSSSEPIKENESVKFGIKTDKPKPVINWKGLDTTNGLVDTGVVGTTKIQKVDQNPIIDSNENSIIISDGEIFSDSIFRIIPDKPNVGSTIRVTGQNFGATQFFEFHIDNEKIGSFETDNEGNFMTTMKIPNELTKDRVDFKIKNNQGEEKTVSLRLGNSENRITELEDAKITINGIDNIVHRGDILELSGTGNPGTSIILEIKDPQQKIINSRTAKVDGTGKWELESNINIPFDAPFGKYTITTSDGRNQNLKYWTIETNKIILLNPTQTMFEAGKIIKFNGTAIPNKLIELMLEDNFGNEVTSDIFRVEETGFVEFEYQTTENDDEEGTWTLVATQNNIKEFIYVGYGEMPTIPVNLEFNKANYNQSDKAIISLIGKPSDVLKLMIINPSGSIDSEEIEIKLQEDGRGTYELELTGYASGIYTAVIKKSNSQSSEKFSVGLQLGSGPIDAKTTQTEYNPGDRILLIGSTNPNVLLKVALVDPNGIEVKSLDVPSKSDGTFTVDKIKIPSNAISGTWKINVSSGSNLDKTEFEVISSHESGMIITIGEIIEIPGFGESIKIGITATQKSSVTLQVFDQNSNLVSEILSCTPTTEFKCEILWTIPKDTPPGTYTIIVSDSIVTEQTLLKLE